MEFVNEQIKKCHDEYVKLLNSWDNAHRNLESKSNLFNRLKLEKTYNDAGKKFNEFVENNYSKVIFETYENIKPMLVRTKTGKKYTWDEVFKKSFSELDKLDKSILVSLIEENGGYKFYK